MSDSEPAAGAVPPPANAKARLSAISLDQASIEHGNHHIEHEREVAIFDILDGNVFAIDGRDDGPYALVLGLADEKLVMTVSTEENSGLLVHTLSLAPFKRIIRDYFMVCDSYYEAIRSAPPAKIQAIDVGRRALHDEGSRLFQDKLTGKITVDFDTARRLFTLIAALHWRG
jgi:uncharacterized protein (UPF0262 family)